MDNSEISTKSSYPIRLLMMRSIQICSLFYNIHDDYNLTLGNGWNSENFKSLSYRPLPIPPYSKPINHWNWKILFPFIKSDDFWSVSQWDSLSLTDRFYRELRDYDMKDGLSNGCRQWTSGCGDFCNPLSIPLKPSVQYE